MFFQLEINICDRFPSVSPFAIRRQKAREVFLLIRRLHGYQENDKKSAGNQAGKPNVIRRPAGDDWF